jgi:uncharacterized protein YbaR (Trm112 family)
MLKPETREQPQHTAGALEDVLQCPSCGSVALIHEDKRVTCPGCRRVYPKLGRIIDMRG